MFDSLIRHVHHAAQQVDSAALAVLLIGAATAAAVLAAAMFVRDAARRKKALVESAGLTAEDPSVLLPEQPLRRGRIDRAFHRLVQQSGAMDEAAALALLAGGAVVGGAAALVLGDDLLLAALGVVLGAFLPVAALVLLRWRRLRRMRRDLPDALQAVADSIRSGKALQQTFEMVAREGGPLLAPEFDFAARQLDLGHAPVAVLQRMADRIPLPEFRIFATAILVHRHSGGNLALLTERLASAARQREQFLGHFAAITAGSRLSAIGLVVGALAGVAVLTLIEPNYLRAFFVNPYGPTLLCVAAGLQLFGLVWAWRILRVQY